MHSSKCYYRHTLLASVISEGDGGTLDVRVGVNSASTSDLANEVHLHCVAKFQKTPSSRSIHLGRSQGALIPILGLDGLAAARLDLELETALERRHVLVVLQQLVELGRLGYYSKENIFSMLKYHNKALKITKWWKDEEESARSRADDEARAKRNTKKE